jgi:hypothetical protein
MDCFFAPPEEIAEFKEVERGIAAYGQFGKKLPGALPLSLPWRYGK